MLSKHAGLIVFLAIAVLASILLLLDLKDSVVIPLLTTSLNIVFRVGAFSVVAFISAKSYLKNGSFQLLLLFKEFIEDGLRERVVDLYKRGKLSSGRAAGDL